MAEDDKLVDFLHEFQEQVCQMIDDDERKAKANLPKAKAAKKMKFLRAIGATDQLDGSTAEVNIDNEHLHLTEFKKISIMIADTSKTPLPFDDSIVVNAFMDIKPPEFDLKKYVSCVKRLYADDIIVFDSSDLCYLLCHARDFSVPRNKLFTFSESGTNEVNILSMDVTLSMPQPCSFTAKLMSLMDGLLVKYSEAKYQQLNMNVTYMILLMTRKMFKGKSHYVNALKKPKTHEDYVNLCPRALCDRLPDDTALLNNDVVLYTQQGNQLFTLILYAYMKSTRLTKRVLEATCIAHMKYTGLGLPMMFDRIVQLYRVSDACLWDALCTQHYESMFLLADFHDTQRKGEAQVPPKTYTLFPYCRVLNGRFHSDLACKNNKVVCYAMACLIDKKVGVDKSHLRKAYWVEKIVNTCTSKEGEDLADAVYEKISAEQ